jgi:aryl-alcohol dehydrogenase-like predicted oxidoreductase
VYQERYWHDRMFEAIERMKPLAEEAGLTLAQMSVAWILRNPVITAPIVGASVPSQLDDALAAVDVVLDDDLMAKLHELTWEFRFGDNQR